MRNVRTGLGYGLAYVAVYCGFVLMLALVKGEAFFVAAGTTLPGVLLAYLTGGIAAGCVVGLLLPLARTKLGAAFIGFVAAIPVFWAAGMVVGTPQSLTAVLLEDALPLAAILGPAAGLFARSHFGSWPVLPRKRGSSRRRT